MPPKAWWSSFDPLATVHKAAKDFYDTSVELREATHAIDGIPPTGNKQQAVAQEYDTWKHLHEEMTSFYESIPLQERELWTVYT